MAGNVLVTGAGGRLGAGVARSLAAHTEVGRVIGLDVTAPLVSLGAADFVRSDVRHPVVGRLLDQADIDTVVHLALSTRPLGGQARAAQKETNVVGTMQLLAACQQSHRLRRIVMRSSGEVYGSSAQDPAVFTEDLVIPRGRAVGAVRDVLDAEGYLRAVLRRRPDLEWTTLRLAHVVGSQMSSRLLDYLALPVVPVPMGYDARLQFLHEDDAVAAVVQAVVGPPVGAVNVAAPGVVTVSQAAALTGRVCLALPATAGASMHQALAWGRRIGLAGPVVASPTDLAFLRHGRVLDHSAIQERLGFLPTRDTRHAFLEAATAFPAPPYGTVTRRWRRWSADLMSNVDARLRSREEVRDGQPIR
ncbi:hypothetical protein KEM60_00976 [Austwickia sp. TVS 96-490-7B]|uniref:NAD-dependent epimerase/dehydratase family protein n=1 Tax=Austwickia sp. TVS 96-490-7B TaxID=2830843 RepID=UPI001C57B99D|nr:NAD-dependent epimerase/dehydratase family protein [Austwickia sp. TVS 96-490-7B]MBW3084787.1 hypothetical protein [Austwickia sp. TVS 96-490-7B]